MSQQLTDEEMIAAFNAEDETTPAPVTVSTEAPAEAPKPPKLTKKQIGQLRRQYFTITHGTVTACGHKAKFSQTQQPNTNCVNCWVAYFMTAVDLEGIHAIISNRGVKELERQKGKKFVKQFHGFLSSRLLPMLNNEVNKALPEMPVPAEESVKIEGSVISVQENETSKDRLSVNDAVSSL
jgi:hypothetical protein